jgi:phenylacetic acid degradation operon negative regulatory protein
MEPQEATQMAKNVRTIPIAPIALAAAAELVARFRRQRPLRGGSLIVTLFGDSILPRGGTIALGSLIDLAAPFGLNERLVRTATARLAHDGWLEGRRAGKLSEYHLSKNGRARFAEATKRIYSEPDTAWSGRWTLLVVPPMRAAERNKIREELVWRGFGEISANVFAHPELDSQTLRSQQDSGGLLSKVVAFDASLGGEDAPQRLVDLGWDLEDLGLRYQRFVSRFAVVQAELKRHQDIEPRDCFLVRTLLIHEYRRLHLRDPLLPVQLLRPNWPGAQAAMLCRDIYARVFGASEVYLSHVASRLTGKLPAAASVLQRFGGIGGPLLQRLDDQS